MRRGAEPERPGPDDNDVSSHMPSVPLTSPAVGNVNNNGLDCRFCGRRQAETRKLIAGPGVYICDACVGVTESVISSGRSAETPIGPVRAVPGQDGVARCSFCGKLRVHVAGLAAMPAGTDAGPFMLESGHLFSGPASICDECVSLCNEIIAEESS